MNPSAPYIVSSKFRPLGFKQCVCLSKPATSLGFSLIELLTVVAIIALLFGFASMAIPSMSSASKFERSVQEIRDTLEAASSMATARNSYVWVGFSWADPSQKSGKLKMITLCSRDGTSSMAADNMFQADKTKTFEGLIQNDDFPKLEVGGQPLSTYEGKLIVQFNNQTYSQVYQFAPNGTMLVQPNQIESSVKLGLVSEHNPANTAEVRASGMNARIRLLRSDLQKN